MKKVCKICGRELDLIEFPKNGKSYRTICKTCENKRIRDKMLITLAYIQSLKVKCEICGYDRNKSALEFHHIDENTKSFNIGSFGCSRIWSRKVKELIDNEVKKCRCLCANCHREIHSKQLSDAYMQVVDFSFNDKTRQQLAKENVSMYNKKFNVNDIITIRDLYKSGSQIQELAIKFNCCERTIYRIVKFKTYKYIK